MSWIPVAKFGGSIIIGGFLLWIGNQIYDGMMSVAPTTEPFWVIVSLLFAVFPFIIMLGAGIWLIMRMQKSEYLEQRW